MKKFKHIFTTAALVAGAVQAQGITLTQDVLTSTQPVQGYKDVIVHYSLIPHNSCKEMFPAFAAKLEGFGIEDAHNLGYANIAYFKVNKKGQGRKIWESDGCYVGIGDDRGTNKVAVFVESAYNSGKNTVAELPLRVLRKFKQ